MTSLIMFVVVMIAVESLFTAIIRFIEGTQLSAINIRNALFVKILQKSGKKNKTGSTSKSQTKPGMLFISCWIYKILY